MMRPFMRWSLFTGWGLLCWGTLLRAPSAQAQSCEYLRSKIAEAQQKAAKDAQSGTKYGTDSAEVWKKQIADMQRMLSTCSSGAGGLQTPGASNPDPNAALLDGLGKAGTLLEDIGRQGLNDAMQGTRAATEGLDEQRYQGSGPGKPASWNLNSNRNLYQNPLAATPPSAPNTPSETDPSHDPQGRKNGDRGSGEVERERVPYSDFLTDGRHVEVVLRGGDMIVRETLRGGAPGREIVEKNCGEDCDYKKTVEELRRGPPPPAP